MRSRRSAWPAEGARPPPATLPRPRPARRRPARPSRRLTRFASCEGFLRHVRSRTIGMVGAYGLGAALPIGASPPPEALRDGVAAPATGGAQRGVDFSDTNVQEAGVDEPDLVETDGRTIFSIAGGRLQATDVTGAAPRNLGSIGFDGMAPTGLLLDGDRLLVIGDTGPRVIGDVPLASRTRRASPRTRPSRRPCWRWWTCPTRRRRGCCRGCGSTAAWWPPGARGRACAWSSPPPRPGCRWCSRRPPARPPPAPRRAPTGAPWPAPTPAPGSRASRCATRRAGARCTAPWAAAR